MSEEEDKARDRRLPTKANLLGYTLKKDRAKRWSYDHHMGYIIVLFKSDFIIAGEKYDLTLDDVEKFLTKKSRP